MAESILDTIKINFTDLDDTSFDADLIRSINATLATLTFQLGVGPEEGFIITGRNETWDSIYTDKRLSMVEEYVKQSVQLDFDPPSNQSMINILNSSIAKLEFRIGVVVTNMEKLGWTSNV